MLTIYCIIPVTNSIDVVTISIPTDATRQAMAVRIGPGLFDLGMFFLTP
jgi:hypothetical protein